MTPDRRRFILATLIGAVVLIALLESASQVYR